MEQQHFFKDLLVVELASVLAGPAVGMFLAELGARVVKIENARTGGDVTRRWKLPEEDPASAHSAYWCSVNWGKEVRLLDLQSDEGRRAVLDLVKKADVVLSNFKPASARRLGVDAAALRRLNPALIFAQLTGFPDGDDVSAFDVVLQAEAGFLHMSGEPGRLPVRMPVALVDLLAAHQLKEGILVALLHRLKTGEGSLVQTSLFEAAVASLANQAANWLMAGHLPQPLGNQHPNIAPYGDIFSAKDGRLLVLAVGTEEQFAALCRLLGLDGLAADRRFRTNAERVRRRRALARLLKPAFLNMEREEWLEVFRKNGVPAGGLRDLREVFETPAAKRMILEERLPDGTVSRRVRTVSFKMD